VVAETVALEISGRETAEELIGRLEPLSGNAKAISASEFLSAVFAIILKRFVPPRCNHNVLLAIATHVSHWDGAAARIIRVTQSSLPVRESKARNLESVRGGNEYHPPAVTMGPPILVAPVFFSPCASNSS